MSSPKPTLSGADRWFDAVQSMQHCGDAYALVTVLGCTGSTPRDHSTKMVITQEETFDTIGGGHLEFLVMIKAREILSNNAGTTKVEQEIHHFPLGASLGQCCGGSATVLIETFAACQFHIGIFGAGHVAKSIVTILAGLPCKVSWVDSRGSEFPETIPNNVKKIVSDDLCDELERLPKGSDILILTHNHQLDFELCLTALKRNRYPLNQLRSIGLIGSKTKALRFQKRLIDRTLASTHYANSRTDEQTVEETRDNVVAQVQMIRCPVGLSEVPGKLPMEVAVSIVGELIAINSENDHAMNRALEREASLASNKHRGLGWQDIKKQLSGSDNLAGEVDTSGHGAVLSLNKKAESKD